MDAYIAKGRMAKAITLETYLRNNYPKVTPDHLRAADPELRNRIADEAGTRKPSDETWDLLCKLYAGEPLPKEYR